MWDVSAIILYDLGFLGFILGFPMAMHLPPSDAALFHGLLNFVSTKIARKLLSLLLSHGCELYFFLLLLLTRERLVTGLLNDFYTSMFETCYLFRFCCMGNACMHCFIRILLLMEELIVYSKTYIFKSFSLGFKYIIGDFHINYELITISLF